MSLKFEGRYKGPGEIITVLNGKTVKISSCDKFKLVKLTESIFQGTVRFTNYPSGNTGTVELLFTRNGDQLVSGNNGLDILKFQGDKLIHTFTPPTTASGKNISGIIVYKKLN